MSGVVSNEPYSRVSEDNGVFDGALIGSAISAGGASAGVFGSRMSHNAIEKNHMQDIAYAERVNQYNADKVQKKFDKEIGKASNPRLLEKRAFKKGEAEHQEIVDRGKQLTEGIKDRHLRDITSLNNSTQEAVLEQNGTRPTRRTTRQTERELKEGYNRTHDKIDSHYGEQIDNVNQTTTARLESNPYVKKMHNIEEKMGQRAEKSYDKYSSKMDGITSKAQEVRQMKENAPAEIQKKQANHRYSKHMGGWKNSAIIGASAAIGGGVGMIADGLNN